MNVEDQERVIEQWMVQVRQSGESLSDHDLHLDAIDPRWKNRQLWVEASMLVFQSGAALRDRLRLPCAIGLGMSLRSDAVDLPSGIRLAELMSLVDWTPPSLYLFSSDEELGRDLKSAIHAGRIEPDGVSVNFTTVDVPAAKSSVFLRFRRMGSDEYACSAFIIG